MAAEGIDRYHIVTPQDVSNRDAAVGSGCQSKSLVPNAQVKVRLNYQECKTLSHWWRYRLGVRTEDSQFHFNCDNNLQVLGVALST